MSDPHVSVILATCHQPTALRYGLLGYQQQTFRDFEIVVADDGSGEETRAVLEEMQDRLEVPLAHVWHEHKGFRKPRIMNEAVCRSRGRLLILSDGDCVPVPTYLQMHVDACPEGGFVVGGYAGLTPEQSREFREEDVTGGNIGKWISPERRRKDRLEHYWNLLSGLVRKKGRPKVRGCNIAVSRNAFTAINGLDEAFDGFGKEDSDLRDRLVRSGAPWKSLWGRSFLVHIDGCIDARTMARRIPRGKNSAYYRRPDVPVRCERGLDSHS